MHRDELFCQGKCSLNSRYVSNLFECYTTNQSYIPQPGVPIETMAEVVDRAILEVESIRDGMKNHVCSNDNPNVHLSLEMVKLACYFQEELVSFNWFNMYDTCQKFFDGLRQTLSQNFRAFESKSSSRLPPTTGPSRLGDNLDAGSSRTLQMENNDPSCPQPTIGPRSLDENSDSCSSHTLRMENDDPSYSPSTTRRSRLGEDSDSCSSHKLKVENDDSSSLDALYYLIFADDPQRGHENMILAALCFDASCMPQYTISKREYMIERWAGGITKHANELGVSLKSAADVLQRVVLQDGGHTANIRDSGAALWKRQRLRAVNPEGPNGGCSYMRNKRWCWNGPQLYRNATEAYTYQR